MLSYFKISLLFGISFSIVSHPSLLMDQETYEWCQEVREILAQPYDALISLGGECQVAYQMRLHGIRNESLPFDWIITPFEGLEKILIQRFEHFLRPENLTFIYNEKEKYVFDIHYGIRFLHDFKLVPDFMSDYGKIQETYVRRIERFLHIIQTSIYPLFIRKKITKEQAWRLRTILKDLCGHENFLILAVDATQEIKENWHVPNVKNFYLRPPVPLTWKGDPLAWQEIFMELGLQLMPTDNNIKR